MAPITDAVPSTRRVVAIVVNYRTPDLALRCVAALARERETLPGLSVILVDGGSADGSAARLAEAVASAPYHDMVELLPLPLNGGFGYANNQAIARAARGAVPPDHVFLVNPDARVCPGALARLIAILDAHPEAAAAGAQLEGEDGAPQGSAFVFPSLRGEFSRGAGTDILRRLLRQPATVVTPGAAAAVPWVTGAAVLLRMAALRETGLFDDGFFLYFEEVELMHRLRRAGWDIWHDPAARVVHEGGSATNVKWGADGFHKRIALPRYWYASRRRYFVRTSGGAVAVLAGLAFLAGRLIWHARMLIERRPDTFPLRTSRDMLLHSLWPIADDRRESVVRLGDAPRRNARLDALARPDATMTPPAADGAAPGLLALIREDWEAHGRDWTKPGFRALAVHRFGVWRMGVRWPPLRAPLSILYRALFRRCRNLYGIELPYSVTVGRGVVIEHQGGIVVHGASVIGDRCIIRQGCTLGLRRLDDLAAAPILEADVQLGAGAVVLGRVRIGRGAVVGANAVVTRDIPAGYTAVGIPARLVSMTPSDASMPPTP